MSILNVDKIQPIGGGSTITVDATDIQASTGTIRASTFSGDVSATGIGVTSLNITGVTTSTGDFSIADSIIHTGDTDTKIRFPAANIITAETGGSELFRINSDRVVIGQALSNNQPTYNASTTLVTSSTNNAAAWNAIAIISGHTSGASFLKFGDKDDEDVSFIGHYNADNSLRVSTGGANERLRITSDGNVGINTVSPQGALDVWGGLYLTSQGSGAQSGIYWSDPDNKSDYFQWYMTTDNDLRLKTAGGAWKDTIHIHNEGRIGIGTDAPATRDVNGSVDIVQNHNNTGPHFRVLNKHATMGGGVQVKNNNARGGVEFLNTSGSNSGALYHTTGGWTWDQTLNLPSSSTYLRIGTNTGNHMLVVDSSSSTDGHIIATFNGAESSNHAGLNIAHYLCGSDDNRTGLYWEHQNVANVRMWMGDDRRLYLKNSDPTESTAQGRYLMTIERGSADFPDGSSYDNAAKSALEIKKHYPNSQTGNYWIYDYNGVPRQIHCEMEIDGGGWMMWHDHNVSNTSMNEALGGTASSPHSGLGRGNYGNYAYYQVLIRASKVGNASREALHTIVQLDHNGNLFRKYNYGEEFFLEEVGNPYDPSVRAYFTSGDGEWIMNDRAYGGQAGSSGWTDFGSGTQTVYIREKDTRLAPGDHRTYAMHERIYGFNDNGVPIWHNSTSMGVLPYWTDIRGGAGIDGSGLNSSGTQTDSIHDNGRTLYSNNGNNGDFLHGRIHGVFLGEFEIAFKLGYWWGWSYGGVNAGIGVAEVIRDGTAHPYRIDASAQYAGFGLNNNSSNNKWYPFHHYNGDTSTTIGNSGSGWSGGNSGFNIMWRESDGTIKVRRQDNTHGTYTFGKFVGPLVFGNGTQSPMFTEVGLCLDKPWSSNGNWMR